MYRKFQPAIGGTEIKEVFRADLTSSLPVCASLWQAGPTLPLVEHPAAGAGTGRA